MLLIVIGLAVSDFITGFIKAYCLGKLHSSTMRKGGLNKLGEVVVMATACGLDIGINQLGKYYNADQLAGIAGLVTAVSVFAYITIMELISILENYAALNPNAGGIFKLIRKLKSVNDNYMKEADHEN